jgi:DNA methyltransferase 1-associated protein 1
MQRELFSLLGENTPPVSVFDDAPRFKDRPTWKQKASPWSWAGFKNPARKDGLVLHHWIRGKYEMDPEDDYAFAQYNQRLAVPPGIAHDFSRADYNQAGLDKEGAGDWTFEETKYLFGMCEDYELRWVVIHDRYSFLRKLHKPAPGGTVIEVKKEEGVTPNSTPSTPATPAAPPTPVAEKDEKKKEPTFTTSSTRTIEDLKSRYYDVCQRLLKLHEQQRGTPLTPTEEEMYKQMKYPLENEIKRKQHLERLLSRSPAEIAEEEALVLESRKLEAAAEVMLVERAEILRLLDAPVSNSKITQYQTSQGLTQLTNTFMLMDKSKKRKDAPNTPVSGSPPSPQSGSDLLIQQQQQLQQKGNNKNGHKKNSVAAAAGGSISPSRSVTPVTAPGTSATLGAGNNEGTATQPKGVTKNKKTKESAKKGAAAGAAAVAAAIQRKLTPQEEAAYGISYHDKLSAGVYLRSSKIATYKQALQGKMNLVLAEMGLPPRPVMPTAKVCAKFDSLQHSISVLLEAKKQADKLDAEIRILRAQKGLPPSGEQQQRPPQQQQQQQQQQ